MKVNEKMQKRRCSLTFEGGLTAMLRAEFPAGRALRK